MHSFSRSTILFLIAASGMALPAFAQDKKKEPKKPVAPASKPAKPAAKAPEQKKGLDGLSAEVTLEQWRLGTLTFP